MFSANSYNKSGLFNNQNKKVDIAIFSAMPEELAQFESSISNLNSENVNCGEFNFKIYEYKQKRILVTSTGFGTTSAAAVVTLVHTLFHPTYLIYAGTAGGINQELKIRDAVIVESAFEAEIQGVFAAVQGTPFQSCLHHPLKKKEIRPIYSADPELLAMTKSMSFLDATVHHGTVVSSNSFPAPIELFAQIKKENPLTIDMETSAFYQVAWLLNAKAIAIRGISNKIDVHGKDEHIHESDLVGAANVVSKIILNIIDLLILKYSEVKSIDVEADDVAIIIKQLDLQPHPEGGYYKRVFQSTDTVKSCDQERYHNENRSAGTSIYYLLKGEDFSAWHRLKSDEIWHYYKGTPIKIHVIDKNGNYTSVVLGDPKVNALASFQISISAGNWFAAEVIDKSSYCLIGCTVSPGFEFKDFELGNRDALLSRYPQHEAIIQRLTRINDKDQNISISKRSSTGLVV